MGLGPNEQRLLGQIERALRGSDPKLAATLANFNRLTFHEAMPLRERLLRPPSRVVRFAPVAIAAWVMFMILISVTVLSRIEPGQGRWRCRVRDRLGAGLPGGWRVTARRTRRGQYPAITAHRPATVTGRCGSG